MNNCKILSTRRQGRIPQQEENIKRDLTTIDLEFNTEATVYVSESLSPARKNLLALV